MGKRRNDIKRAQHIYAAVHSAGGDPEFSHVIVDATDYEVEQGEHYEMAKEQLNDNGYEEPFVMFDEGAAPRWLVDGIAGILVKVKASRL